MLTDSTLRDLAQKYDHAFLPHQEALAVMPQICIGYCGTRTLQKSLIFNNFGSVVLADLQSCTHRYA